MLERADEPVGAALLAMAAQQQVGRGGWLASAQQAASDWVADASGLQAQRMRGQHSVKACFPCCRCTTSTWYSSLHPCRQPSCRLRTS